MITQDELKGLIEINREGPTLDYKQDLDLGNDKKNAEFVKDVLALANSGYPSYLVTGMEEIGKGKNKVWKPRSISKHYSQAQLNQILQYRTDPPISVEYAEMDLNGNIHGIVMILGDNPPYLVMVKDRFGNIQKGTIFTRNLDMNEGARRADLDQMYSKVDLRLSHDIREYKITGDSAEITLNLVLTNRGRMAATFVRASLQFGDTVKIKKYGGWINISGLREDKPAMQLNQDVVHLDERLISQGIVLEVGKEIKQIEAYAQLNSMNMLPKKGQYIIALKTSKPSKV